jgi:alpha-glucosidase
MQRFTLALLLCFSFSIANAQQASKAKSVRSKTPAASISLAPKRGQTDAHGHQWWQHAVFYEIYPRSFADGNNNGMGDLRGITSKLQYLHDLGVDAIWITPMFPSPQVDFGYDVSDYENVDPQYGSLADFDAMMKEGRKQNVEIILDLVVNHTSDKHKWFIESKSSRTNPKRDWYVWRGGKGPNQPPNNWLSVFGHSAWKWDDATKQFYYHAFYPEQPDLNWRNPDVEKAIFDVTRFWYKRGVAGFRLDACDRLFEDPQLRDNPPKAGKNKYGDDEQEEIYDKALPGVHDVLKGLRKVADESHAVLIGETWTPDVPALKEYYGEHDNELQMPMDFLFTQVNKLSPAEFRKQIAGVVDSGGWPVYVLSNHDIRRHYNRYGDGKNNDAIAKVMAALYLTIPGTPIMYYGEEIGMENNDPTRVEDVKDPIGKIGWPQEKGRDGERTPMQWNDSANAGFSTAKPWLPLPASYKTHNVATEQKDPDSILNFYRNVLKLRHDDEAMLDGKYVALNESDDNVLSYLRVDGDRAILVVLNMTGEAQKPRFDLSAQGFAKAQPTVLLTTMKSEPGSLNGLSLEPFAVYIAEVKK